jgi:L-threonylcarbamoyladenylate synthase
MDVLQAVGALRRGDVIVYPTETLYGLGADALNPEAVRRVFELKGRDPKNPIPVLVGDDSMLRSLVAEITPIAQLLIQKFWPGALTLILPAHHQTPKHLLNPAGGIGVRLSNHPVARELLASSNCPLTATSANPSGLPPARTIQQARDYFAGEVQCFLDGGKLESATGSTVVEIIGDRIRIIRHGEISAAQLQAATRLELFTEKPLQ